MSTTYIIRTFGGVFPITLVPAIPPTPNAILHMRSGTAVVITPHGTTIGQTRSGYALLKVRGA